MSVLETGEKGKYIVGQPVEVKRTSGDWNNAVVIGVYQSGIEVEFPIGNTFRGYEYNGEQKMAYKFITTPKIDSYIR